MYATQVLNLNEHLSSNEASLLLEKINGYADVLESILDPNNIIKSISSLSDEEFYTTALLKKSATGDLINEVGAATIGNVATAAMANAGAGISIGIGQTEEQKKKAKALVAGQVVDDKEIDAAISGASSQTEGGILGTLYGLWNSLTEGGSAIGILHLTLDFVGLIGDYFMAGTGIPIGVVADVINAALYFYRGKGLLGVISLIAASIPYWGDIMKTFKPFIKGFFKPFAKITTKGSGKIIAKDAARVLSKADPKSFKMMGRFLQFLKKAAGTVASKVGKVMSFLLDDVIGSAASYLPVIGGPLKRFFKGMAGKLKGVTDNLVTFGKSIDGEIAKEMTKKADETFKAFNQAVGFGKRGGSIYKEGANLVVEKGGKVIHSIPVKEFAKFARVAEKYPAGPMAKFLKQSRNVSTFYEYLAKYGGKSMGFLDKYAGKNLFKKGTYMLQLQHLAAFLSKQMIKLFGAQGDALSDFEKDQMSNIVTTNQLHEIMQSDQQRERDTLNSVVAIPFRDLFSGHEGEEGDVAIALQKHLNYNAQRMGAPNLQTYFAAQAKWNKEKAIEQLYSGMISDEEYEKIVGGIDSKDAKLKADAAGGFQSKNHSYDETPVTKGHNESVSNYSYKRMKYIKGFRTA